MLEVLDEMLVAVAHCPLKAAHWYIRGSNSACFVSSCSCVSPPVFPLQFPGSATELAAVSSKAALAAAGMDPALIDATFVGNVIQSRLVTRYDISG